MQSSVFEKFDFTHHTISFIKIHRDYIVKCISDFYRFYIIFHSFVRMIHSMSFRVVRYVRFESNYVKKTTKHSIRTGNEICCYQTRLTRSMGKILTRYRSYKTNGVSVIIFWMWLVPRPVRSMFFCWRKQRCGYSFLSEWFTPIWLYKNLGITKVIRKKASLVSTVTVKILILNLRYQCKQRNSNKKVFTNKPDPTCRVYALLRCIALHSSKTKILHVN